MSSTRPTDSSAASESAWYCIRGDRPTSPRTSTPTVLRRAFPEPTAAHIARRGRRRQCFYI
eukprot:scaffold4717_cov109-Isochrysis_galbana.AAC.2